MRRSGSRPQPEPARAIESWRTRVYHIARQAVRRCLLARECGTVDQATEIRDVGRRTWRPHRGEVPQPALLIVMNRQGIDGHTVTLDAVQQSMRRRLYADTRDQAKRRAAEVRHAPGAIVGDRQSAG